MWSPTLKQHLILTEMKYFHLVDIMRKRRRGENREPHHSQLRTWRTKIKKVHVCLKDTCFDAASIWESWCTDQTLSHSPDRGKGCHSSSPRVTKKQKRLSTMVSMMASMSVSWMSALLIAVVVTASDTEPKSWFSLTHTSLSSMS